ncbi:MAG: ABC transporter permease, partial [Cyclobacteriaceae bacterium]|nr:ABC transporter permease [Cyclobacteriaceae bacterium HetDA_MAG_MS6]
RDQDKAFNETRVFFVDSTFLEVFDFGIIAGNRSTALDEPNSILLTRSMAQKYFGHEDPMGKLLEFQGHHNYRVTGVLEDAPLNAHFQFDFLVSFSSLKSFYSGSYPRNWYWNPCWTYVVLKDGVNTDEVEQVFPEFVDKYFPDFVKEDITLGLQPVTDIHLHSKLDYEIQANSNIINIYIFSAVALLVLLVATINFVNLSTARASKRAKEVGVRKALGSSRKLLFYQFIFESFLFTCISVSIAIGLALWSIPYFNRLTEKSISLQELLSGDMLTMLSLLILAVGILSGIYPAVILSSFRPLTVLRSLKTGVKGLVFRRALVTIQFGISIILIIGTVFSVMQLQLLQNDDVGFDKEYVIMVPVIRSPMGQHYEAFKDETLKHPSVISMTAVEEIVGSKHQVANYRFGEMERSHPFPHFHVRHDFIETFNIPLAAGRTYDQSFVTDDSLALVVNEQLVASMGWSSAEEAIGKPFHFSRHRGHIVGVIKDFNFLSKHHSISPFVLNLDLNPRAFELFIKYVAIKLDGHNFVESVAHMKNSWKKFIPNRPFEYFFLDDKLAQSYKAEQNLSKVTIIFSVLAILVACLGLFGLATYSVEQRTKEIGIRKVLGIASSQILMLLSKEFMWLILLAFGLSAPLAYLLLDSWLDSFAYRITIVVWPFVSAGVLTFLVSMLTVSYHAYRASRINPVETLKYE